MTVRDLEPAESDWATGLYEQCWGAPVRARRGELVGLRALPALIGAVDEARRTIKPEIPETGRDGIPLRHALEPAVAL